MTDTTITAAPSFKWEGDKAVFAKAFVAAQGAMEAIKKGTENAHFNRKYADLASVVDAVVPSLNAAGIGVIQIPAFNGDIVTITTIMLHESGASLIAELDLRPSKTDPQGIGSATTYGRRYALLAMTGTAPEDDDGNAASGPRDNESRQPTRQQQRAPEVPSASAQFAADQLKAAKTKAEFVHYWDTQKAGLRASMDDANYAHVVAVMKAEAARFPAETTTKPDPEDGAVFPGDKTVTPENPFETSQ